MQDIKSDTFGDLFSKRREDIEFGTVSEVLTVSSSVPCESELDDEAAYAKLGVALKEVPSNNFKPMKVKKGKRASKKIEKTFVSPNKFELLENEDVQMKETITPNSNFGSEVFQKSTSEIPWKTVRKSTPGERKNKCLKYRCKPLENLETKNPFRLLENNPEENVDGVLKRMKEIEYIQTLKKADIKQCRSCTFKKRSCMIDRSSCSAVDKMCVLCKKTGHFPKSLKCKKYRKINCQLTSQEHFLNAKYKGTIDDFDLEEKLKQNEKDPGLKRKRCSKCFITHTPYPKFCRWAKSSEKKKESLPDITKELKDIIKKHIERIESKEHGWEDLIIDAVSPQKDFVSQFPDLILENNRKLKGGAKEETPKQFVSKTDKYNTVLNLLRSSKLFEQFNNHEKCQVTDFCSFCLLRSLMLKINNTKGRKKIIPVEIEIQLK